MGPVTQPRPLETAKLFFMRYFERLFVLVLMGATLLIHYWVDQKLSFLAFYYLPIILAGFYGGRRFAVFSGLFITGLVLFFQVAEGIEMRPGLHTEALLTLIPWAGFLILTGYVVGSLAEQRAARLDEVKNAYMATLELLTFHIETQEGNQQGHSHRVAEMAVSLGKELDLTQGELEDLRIAGLLHEVGAQDQRLLRLLSRSVGGSSAAVAHAMRGAASMISEYSHYYEIVGEEWDIEALPLPLAVKILAVADAFETLQMATPVRPAFPKWSALEEIEKGAGRTFARVVVRALRAVAGRPEGSGVARQSPPMAALKVG